MSDDTRWDGRKILMECGEWVLVPPRYSHITELLSLPIHKPCNSGCPSPHGLGRHEPVCSLCDTPVPEEMEAAYILHNWELRSRGTQ